MARTTSTVKKEISRKVFAHCVSGNKIRKRSNRICCADKLAMRRTLTGPIRALRRFSKPLVGLVLISSLVSGQTNRRIARIEMEGLRVLTRDLVVETSGLKVGD